MTEAHGSAPRMRNVLSPGVRFLQPGDWFFGSGDLQIRTVLGSCVAITLWHERRRIGGMCHFMLPRRRESGVALDGRYGEEAMALLLREIAAADTRPEEYQAKLFGGGRMFRGPGAAVRHVGTHNVDTAKALLLRHGFRLAARHLGGDGHRTIVFCLQNGHVWHRFVHLNRGRH